MNIELKGLNGLDGIDLLKRQWPGVPIIMVSSDADPRTRQQALARGAIGFVSKEKTAANILTVVRQALDTSLPTDAPQTAEPGPTAEPTRLTPRQLEVLDLLCQVLPNKAIGRKLDLTENTLRWHVQGILALLRVANRSEAAFAARQKGLNG